MCGRYGLSAAPVKVRAFFGYADTPNFPPRYNIAPTQPIAIVRGDAGTRRFALVRWGLLPSWVKEPGDFPLLINARSETAAEKPAFRAAMRHRRCLIPANGFYEWRKTPAGKQPYWVRPADGRLLAFAGLWEIWSDRDGGEIETAAILTTASNRRLADIHDRMPAVIPPSAFDAWLDTAGHAPGDVADLLKPAPDDAFEPVPVSRRVNRVSNDDPSLQEPDAPAAAAAEAETDPPQADDDVDPQGSLF